MDEIPYMMTDTPEEFQRVLSWQPGRTITLETTITDEARPAWELYFDACLKCMDRLRECSCHERGYN